MATIDITTQSGAVGNGDLQLQNGAPMDATLRFVTDALNTASPLKLSTSLVQTTSTLKITTNDNPYIDAEDGTGNNRFTVGRAPASQQVNVDFASNPTGSTTAVGAIRTYRDGTNLSEAMTFIEDGSVGIGTTAPVGVLDLYKAAAATRLAIRGDAGQNRLISYRTGALQRFGLYVNNTAESGANAGSDFAIRAYNDAGTLLSTPLFIERSTGNVGVGITSPTQKLDVNGSINIPTANFFRYNDTIGIVGSGSSISGGTISELGIRAANDILFSSGGATERMRITSTGNVGIGTATPLQKLDVRGTTYLTSTGGDGTLADAIIFGNSGFPNTQSNRIRTTTSSLASLNAISLEAGNGTTGSYVNNQLLLTGDGYVRLGATTGGIQFNGDTAAANALDDYEEGTFTATLTPSTSGAITLSPSTCSYTKIGRQVTIRGQVVVSAISSPVGGTIILGGLPFTSNSSVSTRGAGVIQYFPSIGGNSLLNNYQLQTSVEWIWILNASTVTAGDEFYVSLTYFV